LRYSLNEQPPTTASVQMGMHLAQPGSYTLAFTVKGTPTADHLWLTDKETGEKTDMLTDSYTFTIDEPCTLNNRFTLQLSDGITEVKEVREVKEVKDDDPCYDLQGRLVSPLTSHLSPLTSHPSPLQKGIYIQGGKKIIK
jgi:hypothetical protein